jgi:hypothetical protein
VDKGENTLYSEVCVAGQISLAVWIETIETIPTIQTNPTIPTAHQQNRHPKDA